MKIFDIGKHNHAYTTDALHVMHAPIIDCSNRLMASYGGAVLSIDGGIKNATLNHFDNACVLVIVCVFSPALLLKLLPLILYR